MIQRKQIAALVLVLMALGMAAWSVLPLGVAASAPRAATTHFVNSASSKAKPVSATLSPRNAIQTPTANKPQFGKITICQDVTDDGKVVGPTTHFPGGTTVVWAYFPVKNMQDGTSWGRLWERNGDEYLDETGDIWEDGDTDWEAYSLEDEDGLEEGHYTLTLYIDGESVQSASFDVAAAPAGSQAPAAIGPIIFAEGVTDDNDAIKPNETFQPSIEQVYAIFPYMNMSQGQAWAREWVYEGKPYARKDVKWDEDTDGVTYASTSMENGGPMDPGHYTLNIYIDKQLARSASFVVLAPPTTPTRPATGARPQATATPNRPSRPEDLIDPQLLPAWRILYNSKNQYVRQVAQFALDYHIPIHFKDINSLAAYSYNSKDCRVPGQISVSPSYFRQAEQAEIASSIAHELLHGMQMLSTKYGCQCSVEKEYYAYLMEFYVWLDMGRTDILKSKWNAIYHNGGFDKLRLWQELKKTYSSCKLYG